MASLPDLWERHRNEDVPADVISGPKGWMAPGALDAAVRSRVRRQVRFTPFPFEDTAWLVEQCGVDLFMFSTDYPHPEGGRRPFEIFGDAVSQLDDEAQQQFFWRNGAELFGVG